MVRGAMTTKVHGVATTEAHGATIAAVHGAMTTKICGMEVVVHGVEICEAKRRGFMVRKQRRK